MPQQFRFRLMRGSTTRYLRAVVRFATDRHYREQLAFRYLKPKGLFQPSNVTWPNRYPLLFTMARQSLGDHSGLRIMSFGCSTGEEIFSLREHFRAAELKGIDISRYNISICQKRLRRQPDPRMRFERAASALHEPSESYDAIFCMAVFRHGKLGMDRPASCDSLIRFADFDREVTELYRCLKPGGLLFIIHGNFRFSETAVARHFEVVCKMPLLTRENNNTRIYDKWNQLTDDLSHDEVGFRKRPVMRHPKKLANDSDLL